MHIPWLLDLSLAGSQALLAANILSKVPAFPSPPAFGTLQSDHPPTALGCWGTGLPQGGTVCCLLLWADRPPRVPGRQRLGSMSTEQKLTSPTLALLNPAPLPRNMEKRKLGIIFLSPPPPGPLNAPQVGADKPSEPGRCLLPSFGSQGEHRSCLPFQLRNPPLSLREQSHPCRRVDKGTM